MATRTLKLIGSTFVIATVLFVGAVVTVRVVVTPPLTWDASFVSTLKFAFRTIPIEIFAEGRLFIGTIATIIFEIAPPSQRYTTAIATFKIASGMALRTRLGVRFIRIVSVEQWQMIK